VVKIVIPSDKVSKIRRELETSGIDEATIFPDLDGLGRTVSARWKVNTLPPPHANVYTRLGHRKWPTPVSACLPFAGFQRGPHLFMGGNEEMRWISEDTFSRQPKPIRKLYKDFAVLRNGKYDAP
jgi:hypothetical protein